MAENMIELDPKIVAEIEAAAKQIGAQTYADREDGEFTTDEFAAIMGIGTRQAYEYLLRGCKAGVIKRREWRKNRCRAFLYRNVGKN